MFYPNMKMISQIYAVYFIMKGFFNDVKWTLKRGGVTCKHYFHVQMIFLAYQFLAMDMSYNFRKFGFMQ